MQTKPHNNSKSHVGLILANEWSNDIWHVADSIFDPWRQPCSSQSLDFSNVQRGLNEELKYYLCAQLESTKLSFTTVFNYKKSIKELGLFFTLQYPSLSSFKNLKGVAAMKKWRSYLSEKGYTKDNNGKYRPLTLERLLSRTIIFYDDYYDSRDEFEKDIWDVRRIPGARYNKAGTDSFVINYSKVPQQFREITKRYLKLRVGLMSLGQCRLDVASLTVFFKFLIIQNPKSSTLEDLSRGDMEMFLGWYFKNYKQQNHGASLGCLRTFFEYIQNSEWAEAPIKAHTSLLYKEDIPRYPYYGDDSIKFIPEEVLLQLDEKLDQLTPEKHIPIVVVLRASGWRISDVLNIKYDKCLNRTDKGWWLCGDINKTYVLKHRVPITEEIASYLGDHIKKAKKLSNLENNPDKFLFATYRGRRIGYPIDPSSVRRALNQLSKVCGICDQSGEIFHFRNHAFRHTKAVELINNGMNIVHVQKWMAHASLNMTQRYAKLLDSTMRESWENATKMGLFKIDPVSGFAKKVDPISIENEHMIEWEWIRHHLDAVRMPLGYCLKPTKTECHQQLIPCLNCHNLCTTPDFIPQFELELKETRALVERGNMQGRTIWVEKNQKLLERYQIVLQTLKKGETHHKAGKRGREYIGEEKKHVQS